MTTRPQWDDYFLGVAKAVAARGECLRSQVGAVLVDSAHRIVATGYNGVAPGQPSCLDGVCPRGMSDLPSRARFDRTDFPCIAIHAEDNALRDARERGVSLVGMSLYVSREPCEQCLPLLTDLARVIYPKEES